MNLVELSMSMTTDSCSPLVTGALALTRAMAGGQHPHTVYIICVNDEYVKIGFTAFTDARGRIAEIQKGCPYPFRVIVETRGGKPLEQALHAVFKEYRVRDEWFSYDGELREFCRAMAG